MLDRDEKQDSKLEAVKPRQALEDVPEDDIPALVKVIICLRRSGNPILLIVLLLEIWHKLCAES